MDLSHLPSLVQLEELAAVLLVTLAALWLFWPFRSRKSELHDVFGVSGAYELHSADMGGRKGKYIHARGVGGVPDALFVNQRMRRALVGEYKSRRHGGQVRSRERYQVVLYVGILKALHPKWEIEGVLAYSDGLVKVRHDAAEFEQLLKVVPELREVERSWRVVDQRPLSERHA